MARNNIFSQPTQINPYGSTLNENIFHGTKSKKSLLAMKPIKSYLVWQDKELDSVICLDICFVRRRLLEEISLENYVYAEVKAWNDVEAKDIFKESLPFLEMDKLEDSQAYVLRESSIKIEKRFYC